MANDDQYEYDNPDNDIRASPVKEEVCFESLLLVTSRSAIIVENFNFCTAVTKQHLKEVFERFQNYHCASGTSSKA